MIPGPWADDAACKDVPQDDFFSEDKSAMARAAAFCLRCSVREKCLEFALKTDTWFGIFGGLTPRERRRLADVRVKPGPPRQPDLVHRQVKDCPVCKRSLDRADFATDQRRPDGLSGECKACRYDRERRYRQARKQAS